MLETMDGFIGDELKLAFHPGKCTVRPVRSGQDFLGYRVSPGRWRVRRDNVRRFRRRERGLRHRYWTNKLDPRGYWRSVESWLAFAAHADSAGLAATMGYKLPGGSAGEEGMRALRP